MKYKILVIEDDAPLCYLLGRILRSRFDVDIQNDPISAMGWLSLGNLPNLILCDFDLPGVNGLDFIQNIKQSGVYSQIPLVMLSGTSDKKVIDQCLAAGASEFLGKPFDPSELIESISKVLKSDETYA